MFSDSFIFNIQILVLVCYYFPINYFTFKTQIVYKCFSSDSENVSTCQRKMQRNGWHLWALQSSPSVRRNTDWPANLCIPSVFTKHDQSSGSGPVLLSYFTQRTESAQGQQERGIAEETSKIILEESVGLVVICSVYWGCLLL